METQEAIRNHLIRALLAAIAEAQGNEELNRRLHAEVKLWLISMSREELWELAQAAPPPGQSVEQAYNNTFAKRVDELRATASEWLKDLETVPQRGEKNG